MDTITSSQIVNSRLPSAGQGQGRTSNIEGKAKALLGSGISNTAVAAALGITEARISQLLADEQFSAEVTELRYKNLQSHNVRDAKYDSIEDELLIRLEKSLPLMVRPDTILKAIAVVNNAKRRGQSAPEQLTTSQNIVNIILPTQIANTFTVNTNNQVVKAGEQDLTTMQSGSLSKQVEAMQEARKNVIDVLPSPAPAPDTSSARNTSNNTDSRGDSHESGDLINSL